MAKDVRGERPLRKSEFMIVFASSHAQKGWRDLKPHNLHLRESGNKGYKNSLIGFTVRCASLIWL